MYFCQTSSKVYDRAGIKVCIRISNILFSFHHKKTKKIIFLIPVLVIDSKIDLKNDLEEIFTPMLEMYSMKLETRQFNFSLYPAHVETLRNYAWKAIICTQAVLEFDAIYYFDTSVVPRSDREQTHYRNFAKVVKDQANEFEECFLFTLPATNSGFSYSTCASMLDYRKIAMRIIQFA